MLLCKMGMQHYDVHTKQQIKQSLETFQVSGNFCHVAALQNRSLAFCRIPKATIARLISIILSV
jgi:hypothetical protein